ncbi:MAG: 2-hydroxy-3-oxopropionate reductase [Candidatus Sumerlaeia bacterium]|nr:2-hydroxy-3-oxopropionate reductase [Candidatus Sumerlaeia bacterium]
MLFWLRRYESREGKSKRRNLLFVRRRMKTIGFIGLGIMGKPMAKNLLKAGYELTVYDIVPERMNDLAAAGAKRAASGKEVAAASEVVITMLPNSPDVKQAVLGPNGVLEGARPGLILIDMSSIAPAAVREIAACAAERGVAMLDAPVSGGEPKAVQGTLAIMAGGPEEVFEQVKEILGAMGSSVIRIGDIGSGNIAKLANQIIVALNIAAMSEAMVLAAKAGANAETGYQAIRGGLAGSAVLDAKMPMVLAGNFKPGFRIELHIKDLVNALETAHEVGVPVPLTSSVMEILQALKVAGCAHDDHSGMIQFYENLAKIQVRR